MTRSLARSSFLATAAAATLLALSGCTEKPQTQTRQSDTKGWEATPSGYTASGFKTGDPAAWEAQLRKRAQGQNEYSRAVSAP